MTADLDIGGERLSVHGEMTPRDRAFRGPSRATIPMRLIGAIAGRESLAATGRLIAKASFAGLTGTSARIDGVSPARAASGRPVSARCSRASTCGTACSRSTTLTVRSNLGTAKGGGRLAIFDTTADSELGVGVVVTDLSPLRPLLRSRHARGRHLDRRDPRVRSEGRAALRGSGCGAIAGRRPPATAPRRGAHTDGELDASMRPSRSHAELSVRRVHGLGIPILEGELRVDMRGNDLDIDATGARDERHRMHFVGTLRGDSLVRHIAIETLDVHADSVAWALTHPTRIEWGPDRLEVHEFALHSPAGRVDATGVIDRRGEQSFRLDVRGVRLGLVSTWLGRPDVTGTLDADLALSGPATAPRGLGGVDVDVIAAGHHVRTVRSRLEWNGARVQLGGRFASPKDDSLSWIGDAAARAVAGAGRFGRQADAGARGRGRRSRHRAHDFPRCERSRGCSIGHRRRDGPVPWISTRGSRAAAAPWSATANIAVSHGAVPLPGARRDLPRRRPARDVREGSSQALARPPRARRRAISTSRARSGSSA